MQTAAGTLPGQRLGGRGQRVGTNFRVSDEHATGDETFPAASHNPTAGEFLVVWSEHRLEGISNIDIKGQRVTPDGRRKGSNFAVSRRYGSGPAGLKGQQDLVAAPLANRYLVVWSDNRHWEPRGTDIF